MNTELDQQIGAFLAAHHVMSLATMGSSGPHATSLLYACDGLALVWVSEPDSRHSREIEADLRVSYTYKSSGAAVIVVCPTSIRYPSGSRM
jgi:nitroimidazol reductase NimA-like FMN-containing flavoprotein (pyridoxamine 5'-phosphate oxidase superfamily)